MPKWDNWRKKTSLSDCTVCKSNMKKQSHVWSIPRIQHCACSLPTILDFLVKNLWSLEIVLHILNGSPYSETMPSGSRYHTRWKVFSTYPPSESHSALYILHSSSLILVNSNKDRPKLHLLCSYFNPIINAMNLLLPCLQCRYVLENGDQNSQMWCHQCSVKLQQKLSLQ